MRERPVLPIETRIGVRAGFDRSPVVAGRNRDGIDTVHDALVVGGRPIRIRSSNIARHDDGITDGSSVEVVNGQLLGPVGDTRGRQRAVGEIGKDAHRDRAAADLGDVRRDRLADRVDQVCTHRVAGIHEQVHHERCLAAGQ